jgi:hypothetical protein
VRVGVTSARPGRSAAAGPSKRCALRSARCTLRALVPFNAAPHPPGTRVLQRSAASARVQYTASFRRSLS